MCCCSKPNVNGTPGAYSWDGQTHTTRAPQPPPLACGDTLLYDEPGRCGGIDAHSHHFRLVRWHGSSHYLLVRHGGGDERIPLGAVARLAVPALGAMDSDGRFWLLHTIYSAGRDAAEVAASTTVGTWRRAAAEKRIKTRKVRGGVKVWIEPPPAAPAAAA